MLEGYRSRTGSVSVGVKPYSSLASGVHWVVYVVTVRLSELGINVASDVYGLCHGQRGSDGHCRCVAPFPPPPGTTSLPVHCVQ